MSEPPDTSKTPILLPVVGLVLIVAGLGWWYVMSTLGETGDAIAVELAAERVHMQQLLQLLERSEGDAYANAVVRDCPPTSRRVFDELLSRLDGGLSAAELDRLELLYHQCADFYAVRRHLMALRLEETVHDYAELLTVARTLPTFDVPEVGIDQWTRVAELEREKSEYFTELVAVQGRIITELQAGNRAGSPTIATLQQEAQTVQDNIGSITVEVNAIKPDLSDL